MTHVEMSTAIPADADSLWGEIGAFGRVDWHPWLERVETEGRRRIPYDKKGRRQIETLQESNAQARCYRYTIDSSPMPIRNHSAELRIDDNHDGTSTVHWSADFDVDGPDPSSTVATVEQFMRAGLDSLRQRHAADARRPAASRSSS
jgi:Polyketide cyclase / dehydrase and lipid transport